MHAPIIVTIVSSLIHFNFANTHARYVAEHNEMFASAPIYSRTYQSDEIYAAGRIDGKN